MKKILFLILLIFSFNVKADMNTSYITIEKNEDISEVYYSPNIKEIHIKNMIIDDISFINNLDKLEKLNIFYSKINLTNFDNKNLRELNIISSYIVNDDMSKLKNSKVRKIDLDGSYITSIFTLKNIETLEELSLNSISNLRSLEPIISLPNLKKLNFVGSEELVNGRVINYMMEKNIIGETYDSSKYGYLNNGLNYKLNEIINDLNLDGLDDLEKIRKITLYVTNLISYDDACGVYNKCTKKDSDFNLILSSLSGKGICYNYAILTNKLLNKIGIKSYLVSGVNRNNITHEWLNVYLDGIWYGLDPTWIDTYSGLERTLKNTGKSRFFMSNLDTDKSFSNVRKADVYPSKIVDPNAVIIDKEEEKEVIEKPVITENNDDTYHILFLISISILLIFSIVIIIKHFIKRY